MCWSFTNETPFTALWCAHTRLILWEDYFLWIFDLDHNNSEATSQSNGHTTATYSEIFVFYIAGSFQIFSVFSYMKNILTTYQMVTTVKRWETSQPAFMNRRHENSPSSFARRPPLMMLGDEFSIGVHSWNTWRRAAAYRACNWTLDAGIQIMCTFELLQARLTFHLKCHWEVLIFTRHSPFISEVKRQAW